MIGAHDDARKASDFARVHAFARSAADVPDDQDARLVVLPAERLYEGRHEFRGVRSEDTITFLRAVYREDLHVRRRSES